MWRIPDGWIPLKRILSFIMTTHASLSFSRTIAEVSGNMWRKKREGKPEPQRKGGIPRGFLALHIRNRSVVRKRICELNFYHNRQNHRSSFCFIIQELAYFFTKVVFHVRPIDGPGAISLNYRAFHHVFYALPDLFYKL